MSQKTIPQSIFGDQTNIKRCVQPPGGNSSIMFGGDCAKSDAVKGINHQASDIFNLDENKEVTKKQPAHSHQEDTQSRCFGGEHTKAAKADDAHKNYNPITGEVVQNIVTKKEEEHDKKDVATVIHTTTSCTTSTTNAAAAGISTRAKQPPGGKSTKLW